MWRSITLGLVGAAFVASAVLVERVLRRNQDWDQKSVAVLAVKLDSVRALYASATTAADSARLKEQVDARVYGFGQRQFHIPIRQELLNGWWKPSGGGTLLAATGLILLFSGIVFARRAARGRQHD